MQSATETFTVERELTIDAQPETVWKLLAEPAEQSRWWGTALDFEARPSGPFRVEVIPGHIARGEFIEVDAPRRLVYTFGWEGEGNPVPPGSSTIEIELREERRPHAAQIRAQRAPDRGAAGLSHARLGQLPGPPRNHGPR